MNAMAPRTSVSLIVLDAGQHPCLGDDVADALVQWFALGCCWLVLCEVRRFHRPSARMVGMDLRSEETSNSWRTADGRLFWMGAALRPQGPR